MTASFYWYDLETSGTDPRWDRVVQFAGLRTDRQLVPVGDEECFYVRLPDDVLPNPDAALVTGITPELTVAQGIDEWQATGRINALFAAPETCTVGYNSLRFDDEFVRYGLYRTLRDPYAREWQNGNSRWDIIDLVRATGALRRDGIEWPRDSAGLPVYKLELLTVANNIDHGQAHDALSDVRATVALAQLIKRAQPKLFNYYFDLRFKKAVRNLLEPLGARVCVHVSGMYPRTQYGAAPILSICRHPRNSNSIVVADLSQDIEPLLTWSAERIREGLFSKGGQRPPLKEIRVNRCPFVAELSVLTDENWSRLGFDAKEIKHRQRRLAQPGVLQKVMRAYSDSSMEPAVDVDAALYEGFLQDDDRRRCEAFGESLAGGDWTDLDYADKRLASLAQRLKARSFTTLLSAPERADWRSFVTDKLHRDRAPWLTLGAFRARLAELQAQADESAEASSRGALLAALAQHADELARRYPPK